MRLTRQLWARRAGESGYAMAALLVGLSVMGVLMSMALPVWSHVTKREKEEELIWRGNQYARAVGLFMRKYANTYPPTLDVLVEQKFLRKKYKDPVTNEDFQIIPAGGGPNAIPRATPGPGQPTQQIPMSPSGQPRSPSSGQMSPTGQGQPALGVSGVVSKSKDSSIKIYNGRTKYNEWAFVYIQTAQAPASQFPGMPGQPGRGGPNMPGRGGSFPGQMPGRGGRGGFDPMRPSVDGSGFPGPGRGGFGQPSPFNPPQPFGQPTPSGQPGTFPQPGMQPRPQRPPGD
jgi:type II secretory pathway pseudopilin PulG